MYTAALVRRFVASGVIAAGLLLGPNVTVAAEDPVTGPFSFTPLARSATCGSQPLNAPFVLPAGFSQQIIESQASDADFHDLPDMNQLNETGGDHWRYLYRTHEVGTNGSVSVTDLETGDTRVLAQRADWERFDGLKWTPWGTVLAAEEVGPSSLNDPSVPQAINGLLYEIDPRTGVATVRPALGSVSHEGIGIDRRGYVYVIDEFAQGGIFRFVPDRPEDLSAGQLSVLKVIDETSAPGNKTGRAIWVPIDDAAARTDARAASLAVGATPYGRPEDVEIVNDVLYVAITSEDRVLAIDLNRGDRPMVTDFVRAGLNVPVEQNAPGESENDSVTGFNSPDNLAADRAGNLYIAEDNSPGDIWAAPTHGRPSEPPAVHLFASLSDCEAEPTGIYFGQDPKVLYVNVQHAGDGNDKAMAITNND